MTFGTSGWLCPKCNTVYAPSQTTCAACSGTRLGFGTLTLSGTILRTSPEYSLTSGTFFVGPRPSVPPPPPVRDWKEERAEEIIKQWKGGKWSALQELIVEALEEAEDED